MKLHTIQLAKHRLAKEKGLEVTDITIKSNIHRQFAPTWAMVKNWKESEQTDKDWEDYTTCYRARMNHTVRFYPEIWQELCERDEVVIACMCPCETEDPLETKCHRMLLVGYLEKFCAVKKIPFEYLGEIR